jgi:hypothetical protein
MARRNRGAARVSMLLAVLLAATPAHARSRRR